MLVSGRVKLKFWARFSTKVINFGIVFLMDSQRLVDSHRQVLQGMEDPEKVLDQALDEMQVVGGILLLMAEIRRAPVEGKVVFPIIYRVSWFHTLHPRWLFGISAINSMFGGSNLWEEKN